MPTTKKVFKRIVQDTGGKIADKIPDHYTKTGSGSVSIFREHVFTKEDDGIRIVLAMKRGKSKQITMNLSLADFALCLTGQSVATKVSVLKHR